MDDPDLGAHSRVLHASQEYDFHRPLRPGDVLRCTPSIAGLANRRGNDFLTLHMECVDDDTGAPVLTSRGILVFLAPED